MDNKPHIAVCGGPLPDKTVEALEEIFNALLKEQAAQRPEACQASLAQAGANKPMEDAE